VYVSSSKTLYPRELNDGIHNSHFLICEFSGFREVLANLVRVSEDAVESDELDIFLRLNESYIMDEDHPTPPAQPVGVPGAASPLQMTPDHLRSKMFAQSSSPLKGKGSRIPVNKRENDFDVSTELGGYGLQGVKVTEDELRDLVAELGLEGDDAGDLVKGLSGSAQMKDKVEGLVEKGDKANPAQEEKTTAEGMHTKSNDSATNE
jgi:SH3 domain-binding glutamic acid-rich protein